ncbi:MAG: type II toxin-antitoxin system HicA family toxin [Leptolyngbyaceae cyanobacterium RM2_2_4]|nr:type II toxin-antitoxin system HicA family toxin [Leptolyngbyaceae cyanobacterium SM1_4_3]NJN89445.1 type II toxin-antitoxin system HicA family toxin [Leptolyngbyaceae cyanobacterium SL_5_14]NJO52375.1 type II toxin-antitoxin system HicA family toxin [Leptolyngbyaceae cyanobacterium RM2_2_4]
MPKKIREIRSMLAKSGFERRPGKGSHQVWSHPRLARRIVIARKDGDDAPPYLEKQVEEALRQLEEMEGTEE